MTICYGNGEVYASDFEPCKQIAGFLYQYATKKMYGISERFV